MKKTLLSFLLLSSAAVASAQLQLGTAEDKARNILDEVKAAVSKFSIIAQENGIPQDWIDRISEVLKTLVKE